MRFTNLTRATEIGANCYLLEIGGRRVVLDAGMHPTEEGDAALPNLDAVEDRSVDAILVSHAHLDHIGSLPVLMRRQPQAAVFLTGPTARLGETLLHNSVNVMSRSGGGAGLPPSGVLEQRSGRRVWNGTLFTHRETELAAQQWRECALRTPFAFDGERLSRGGTEHGELSFEFFDAGHILGSAGILLREGGRRIFYTGDVNFIDQTISKAASFPTFTPREPLDALIVETTRGDAPIAPGFDRKKEEQRLAQAIKEAFKRGGAVLIPVFALGKTQELMAMLLDAKRRGVIAADAPITIGGLSTKMTEVYDRYASQSPRQLPGVNLMNTVSPYVIGGREAADTPIKPGRIYALSSGMMTEQTLSYLFARRMIGEPRHSIFFVGYADPNSPGGRLKFAKPGERVRLDEADAQAAASPELEVRCTVDRFDFSAHADRESLREFVRRSAPKKVVLVHGDLPALDWFRKTLAVDLPKTEVIVPPPGQAIEI